MKSPCFLFMLSLCCFFIYKKPIFCQSLLRTCHGRKTKEKNESEKGEIERRDMRGELIHTLTYRHAIHTVFTFTNDLSISEDNHRYVFWIESNANDFEALPICIYVFPHFELGCRMVLGYFRFPGDEYQLFARWALEPRINVTWLYLGLQCDQKCRPKAWRVKKEDMSRSRLSLRRSSQGPRSRFLYHTARQTDTRGQLFLAMKGMMGGAEFLHMCYSAK